MLTRADQERVLEWLMERAECTVHATDRLDAFRWGLAQAVKLLSPSMKIELPTDPSLDGEPAGQRLHGNN